MKTELINIDVKKRQHWFVKRAAIVRCLDGASRICDLFLKDPPPALAPYKEHLKASFYTNTYAKYNETLNQFTNNFQILFYTTLCQLVGNDAAKSLSLGNDEEATIFPSLLSVSIDTDKDSLAGNKPKLRGATNSQGFSLLTSALQTNNDDDLTSEELLRKKLHDLSCLTIRETLYQRHNIYNLCELLKRLIILGLLNTENNANDLLLRCNDLINAVQQIQRNNTHHVKASVRIAVSSICVYQSCTLIDDILIPLPHFADWKPFLKKAYLSHTKNDYSSLIINLSNNFNNILRDILSYVIPQP